MFFFFFFEFSYASAPQNLNFTYYIIARPPLNFICMHEVLLPFFPCSHASSQVCLRGTRKGRSHKMLIMARREQESANCVRVMRGKQENGICP